MLHTSRLGRRVIGCAIEVHRALGPGLLESTYRTCLTHELLARGEDVQVEVPVPLTYKGARVECAFRADIIVNGILLLETKSVEKLLPIHDVQAMTYLRLLDLPQGLLLNFNVLRLKDGLKSILNNRSSKRLPVDDVLELVDL